MRGYIHGALGQSGKAQKLAQKANATADGAQEEDAEFPEPKQCLMIFEGS
jgi:ABC-type hemin transport system substrate-binding protein